MTFHAEPQNPPPSWDKQIGPMLKGIVRRIGAPEGWMVDESEIFDTGTALELRIPQFADRFTFYVTSGLPSRQNTNTAGMQPIQQHGDYVIYRKTDDRTDIFIAESSEWSVSLGAYKNANGSLLWDPPEAPRTWMETTVDAVERNRP